MPALLVRRAFALASIALPSRYGLNRSLSECRLRFREFVPGDSAHLTQAFLRPSGSVKRVENGLHPAGYELVLGPAFCQNLTGRDLQELAVLFVVHLGDFTT
jgi:hypothetical protein